MSDQPKPNRSLSEISHLFLSSVRDRHTAGMKRPERRPPGAARMQASHENELSPQELAAVNENSPMSADVSAPPIRAVIAPHLNGKQLDYVKRYARFLAAADQRIGLIEIDVSEFRLMTFERGSGEPMSAETAEFASMDSRAMSEAIAELNTDVDMWLLLVCNPRLAEGRELLRLTEAWTLLTTCDHDGVVGAYRTLKSLADVHRPPLTVAMLDSKSVVEADQVYRKLNGVCEQFLHWPLESGESVTDSPDVVEHLVMCCHPMTDKAQVAAATNWQVVAEMLNGSQQSVVEDFDSDVFQQDAEINRRLVGDVIMPFTEKPSVVAPLETGPSGGVQMTFNSRPDNVDEVVDLPDGVSETAVLSAVFERLKNDLAECPIRPPMCEGARLAIGRDRRLVLLAVDRQGLGELRAIASAFRWLNENRRLVAMALPQFAIDVDRVPQLRLLIDQSDASAESLQPMLQAETVQVQTYRRVRWGGKNGLLLQAA